MKAPTSNRTTPLSLRNLPEAVGSAEHWYLLEYKVDIHVAV